MPDSFAEYMKKEVVQYIKEETDKGVAIKKIRHALLEGGHHHDLIEEAILALLKHNFNLEEAMKEPVKSKTLSQELYAEVLASLIDYIEFQKKQGYTMSEIKKILLDYGHSQEILNNALKAVGKDSNEFSHFKNIRFIILSFLFVVFLLWVSASTADNISKILVGFFPTIASLIVIGVMVNRLAHKQLVFLWLLPFVFAAVFLVLAQSESYVVFEGMKIYNLAVLNAFISVIFSIILINPARLEPEPEPMSDLVKKEMVKEIEEKKKEEEKEEPKEPPRMRIKEIRPA